MAAMSVPKLRVDLAQTAELEELQLEPGFSAEFLCHYCETKDLEQVTYLEIQVDSATQSLELLGEHLPKLRQLKLTDPSSVLSLRDLGSGLKHLEVLWMSRCGLQDLGGASALLPSLRELYLSFNDVVDATPLSGCEQLEVLDLEGNAIVDEEDIRALGSCSHLRELNLAGNPVYRTSCKPGALTRERVIELLPNLEVLDDLRTKISSIPRSFECVDSDVDDPFDANFPSRGTEAPASEPEEGRDLGSADEDDQEPQHPLLLAGFADRRAEIQGKVPFAGEPDETELILEQLKRARRQLKGHAFTARPAFGGSGPSASGASGFGVQLPRRTKTAENQEGFRPATASNSRLRFEDMMPADSASDLTCGETLAGNPLRALRQRHPSGASTAREVGMDIRQLLQRYQTYTQPGIARSPSTGADQSPAARAPTPDVRVRTPKSFGSLPEPRTPSGKSPQVSEITPSPSPSPESSQRPTSPKSPVRPSGSRKGRPPLPRSNGYHATSAGSSEVLELS
ncbi:LRRC56 [Symbiodinium sp. CCMP2456]|nr:LRRC56 [Symbiodinium sp. CCMP2456]